MESFPPTRGARPIRNPVNRENVTRDVEGQGRVYDIISVLPLQRYGAREGVGRRGGGTGKGSTARSVHKVSSRANSHEIVAREALRSLEDGMSRSLTSQAGNPASVLRVRHWI